MTATQEEKSRLLHAEESSMVQKCFPSDSDINEAKNYKASDETMLMIACKHGNGRMVEVLLKAGAGINVSNKHGKTATMFARENGNEKIVAMLMEAGADINTSNKYSGTPLIMTRTHDTEKNVETMMPTRVEITTLKSEIPLVKILNNGKKEVEERTTMAKTNIKVFNKLKKDLLLFRVCLWSRFWSKVHTNKLFTIMILLALANIASGAEIVMLKNSTHFTCVTDIETPLFLFPLREDSAKTSVETNKEVFSSNWLLEDSTNIEVGAVTDKRWEDFETIYTDYHKFKDVNKSVSFSLYSPDSIEFFMDDHNKLYFYERQVTIRDSWVHYTVILRDGNIYLYENNHLIDQYVKHLIPSQIVVKASDKVYWKLHKYQVRTSTLVSDGPETIDLSTNNPSCWMLYMALCPHCQIKVIATEINHISKGISEKTKIGSWQQLKINSTSILLNRQTTDSSQNGFWAIYIRECPKLNKSIFQGRTDSEKSEFNKTCQALLQDGTTMNTTAKTNLSLTTVTVFNPEYSRHLGQMCDVSCADLFGAGRQFCEGYKICLGANCSCSWGYKGQECKQDCEDGSWGLSCNQRCSECRNCNNKTGQCNRKDVDKKMGHYYSYTSSSEMIWSSPLYIVLILLRDRVW